MDFVTVLREAKVVLLCVLLIHGRKLEALVGKLYDQLQLYSLGASSKEAPVLWGAGGWALRGSCFLGTERHLPSQPPLWIKANVSGEPP